MKSNTIIILFSLGLLLSSCTETDRYKKQNEQDEKWMIKNTNGSRKFLVESFVVSLYGPISFEDGLGDGDVSTGTIYFNDNWIVIDKGILQYNEGKARHLSKYKINRVIEISEGFKAFEAISDEDLFYTAAIAKGGNQNNWRLELWCDSNTFVYYYMKEVY